MLSGSIIKITVQQDMQPSSNPADPGPAFLKIWINKDDPEISRHRYTTVDDFLAMMRIRS